MTVELPEVIVIVARTHQDWGDVRALAVDALSPAMRFLAFDTHPVYREGNVLGREPGCEVSSGVNPFRAGYYQLDPFRRLVLVVLNAWKLVSVTRRNRVSAIISAPPVAYARLARFVLPTVRLVGYLRSAFPSPATHWSLTERLQQFLSRLGVRVPAFLNAYWADRFLVAGTATVSFLRERGVPSTAISVVGPGRLGIVRGEINDANPRLETRRPRRLVYVAQAFLRHGDGLLHGEQIRAIESLAAFLRVHAPDAALEIRPHPRDDESTILIPQKSYSEITVSRESPEQFLDRAIFEGLVLVGLTSTLLFEAAYLGGRAVLYGTESAIRQHEWFYSALGATPFSDPHALWERGVCQEGIIGRAVTSRVLAFPDDCDFRPQSAEFRQWLTDELSVGEGRSYRPGRDA